MVGADPSRGGNERAALTELIQVDAVAGTVPASYNDTNYTCLIIIQGQSLNK